MSSPVRSHTVAEYEHDAREYCRSLPLEHFMEAHPASTQRKITLESFDLLHGRWPDLQVFNELLIQYLFGGRIRRVVPDNIIRICKEPLVSEGSFILEHEPVGPLVVMEYVSPSSERKDYVDNYRRYERELRVPYCLFFHPEDQELRFYRHTGTRYEAVTANAKGRLEVPELQVELAILNGWVRYWHRGKLLELPGELDKKLKQEKRRANQEKKRADQAEAELAKLKAMLGHLNGGQANGTSPSN